MVDLDVLSEKVSTLERFRDKTEAELGNIFAKLESIEKELVKLSVSLSNHVSTLEKQVNNHIRNQTESVRWTVDKLFVVVGLALTTLFSLLSLILRR